MKFLGLILPLFVSVFAAKSYADWPCARSRVTWISDSHSVGAFGMHLNDELVKWKGFERHYNLVSSSNPQWWLPEYWPAGEESWSSGWTIFHDSCKDAPIAQWDRANAPGRGRDIRSILPVPPTPFEKDVVIIVQGTNWAGVHYAKWATQLAMAVHHLSPGALCIWVGPPKMTADWARDEIMEQSYAGIKAGLKEADSNIGKTSCHLVDSRLISKYPDNVPGREPYDGVHYPYGPEAQNWGKGVAKAIRKLARPSL